MYVYVLVRDAGQGEWRPEGSYSSIKLAMAEIPQDSNPDDWMIWRMTVDSWPVRALRLVRAAEEK